MLLLVANNSKEEHVNTNNDDNVDFPQPLVPHNRIVTDSLLSRILETEEIISFVIQKMNKMEFSARKKLLMRKRMPPFGTVDMSSIKGKKLMYQ